MRVILFAGGTVQAGLAVTKALAEGELIIAADDGASTALALGYMPAFAVGDFDSLSPQTQEKLEKCGCQIIQAPIAKDETDTELAIEVALKQGASHISLVGALGGTRFDHTIANILLLAAYTTIAIELVDGDAHGWLLQGPGETHITGKEGDLLSLFPLTASAEGVRTTNLSYPLHGETLSFGRPRGVSNTLLTERASVSLAQGLLFIVHTAT